MSVVTIKLSEIVNEDNRKYTKDDGFEQLVNSIRKVGIIHMPTVKKREDGKYCTVAGRRRIAAARIVYQDNPDKEINCDQLLEIGDATAEDIALAENINRQEMHPLDEAALFQGMADKGLSVEEIAKYYARSPSAIYKRLRLNTLIDELKTGFRDGILNITGAAVLAELPEEDQKKFYEKHKNKFEYNKEEYAGIVTVNFCIPEGNVQSFIYESQKFKINSCLGNECKTCEKRTHNENNDLLEFGDDVDYVDVCFDSECYRAKYQEALSKVMEKTFDPKMECNIHFNGKISEQLYKRATHVELDLKGEKVRFEVFNEKKYEFTGETTRKKNVCYTINEIYKGDGTNNKQIHISVVGYKEKVQITKGGNAKSKKGDPVKELINNYGKEVVESLAVERSIPVNEMAMKLQGKYKASQWDNKFKTEVGENIKKRIINKNIEQEKSGEITQNYMLMFLQRLEDEAIGNVNTFEVERFSKEQKQWLQDLFGNMQIETYELSPGTQKFFHFLLLTIDIDDVPELDELKDVEKKGNVFFKYANMTKEEYKALYLEVAKEVVDKALPKEKAKVIKAEKAAAPHGKDIKKAASGAAEAKPRKAKKPEKKAKQDDDEQRCRICGCTHFTPCIDPGGDSCFWVEDDLCSSCATEEQIEAATSNTIFEDDPDMDMEDEE